MRRHLALVAVVTLAGCGAAPDPNAAVAADLEEVARGANRAFGLTTAFVQAGVVQVTALPADIVTAVQQRVQTETNSCASTQVNGASLTATFDGNGSKGCKLASVGITVTGTTTLVVTGGMGSAALLTFQLNLNVDGKALSGTITARTTDGNTYVYQSSQLGWDSGTSASLPALTPGYDAMQATITATGMMTGRSGTNVPIMLTSVETGFTDCYPDDGNAVATLPKGAVTVSFTADGARSGVAVIGDPATSTITTQLPSRLNCPR